MESILDCTAVRDYIDSLEPKETDDPMSLCSLLARRVSQSTNIRLGICLETILNLRASSACMDATDLRPRAGARGTRQKDFLRGFSDRIVYAEFKSNINLDTEKRRATRQKINDIAAQLVSDHPGKPVSAYLVSLRYLRAVDIPATVAASYSDVTLIGVADFFQDVLSHPMEEFQTYDVYTDFLMEIVDQLEPEEE
jgi:hypothetical protein